MRLSYQQTKRLRKADHFGDGFYYLPEDLTWACKPTDEDPGITEPKPGAVAYNKDGTPVFGAPDSEEVYESLRDDF